MTTKWTRATAIALAAALSVLSAGCGDLVRQGRSPVQLVINSLQVASGAEPDELGTILLSDVVTEEIVFNDVGEVTMSLILKDPGQPGLAASPTAINQVTINRYRVVYRRSDGRNTPGVDVPFPFDSAVTFTVPTEGSVSAGFEIVRHVAKQEAPLRALRQSGEVISTMTEVTFFGRDQAGNEISVSGTVGINFGNFADPE